jgi:hypothetical protein
VSNLALADAVDVLSTPAGQRFVARLVAMNPWDDSGLDENPYRQAAICGAREAALRMKRYLLQADPNIDRTVREVLSELQKPADE